MDDNKTNIVEFLKFVYEKLDPTFKRHYNEVMRIQTLRRCFNIEVSMESLRTQEAREQFLQKGIEYIYDRLKQHKLNIVQKAWNDITVLAKALLIDEIAAIIQLLKHFSNLHFSCALSKCVLDLCVPNNRNVEHFISLAMLLLAQQIEAYDTGKCCGFFFKFSVFFTVKFLGSNDKETPLTYPLAYKLLQNVIGNRNICSSEIRDLMQWPSIGNDAYSLNEIYLYFQQNSNLSESVSTFYFSP